MAEDYLLVLAGHNVTREIELDEGTTLVRAGTTPRCEVRFRKELFFVPFELELSRDADGVWSVSCSEGVYLGGTGVQKRAVARLSHGDELVVRYAATNAKMFDLRFSINFERERGAYDRSVALMGMPALSIGPMPNCNLVLHGPHAAGDLLVLEWQSGHLALFAESSVYGTYVDGRRLVGQVILADRTFFSVANFHFYYKGGRLYFSKSAPITANGVTFADEPARQPFSDYPRFNRNTRIRTRPSDEPVTILDPPQKPDKPGGNIILQLLPAVGMLAITVLVRGMLSTTSGTYVIVSALSISLGIVTSVLSIVEERRTYKKDVAEREETYHAYIAGKRTELEGLRAEELEVLRRAYPTTSEELGLVRDFSGKLFDRRDSDDDFLHVRMGTGERESLRQVSHEERETFEVDELAELPAQVRDDYRYLHDAPIELDLKASSAVGVVGSPERRWDMLRTMVVDLVARQHDSELRLFFVCEPAHEGVVHWARMLPHVQNAELGCRNVACDPESRTLLFEWLFRELTARAAVATAGNAQVAAPSPRYVVFFVDECGFKTHPLSKFTDVASMLGACFVFFEQATELLPMGCDHVVMLSQAAAQGLLVESDDDSHAHAFAYEQVPEEAASRMALTLAPVYSDEVSLEGELTSSYTMFDMLGIIAADDLDLGARWAGSAAHRSMAAPIGLSKTHVVELDLHDKAHGPHGLVAGTTGSGKSEVLQTYILSVATLYHPYDVGFMIIDFKGGGMVNQFRDLPHLMGAITNIDGREIDRSLKSIKAELRKRQRLFAEAGVNHIDAYIRLYKAHEVAEPLPHLVIIVDEFAELKAEQPEFMKELISTARIGRSLGVHLILATQKPAGQVNEQIWSNSRFKLCLKVASASDSNEVLKSPLAAEIKEPGRAYLQVGNNEIFELFQSAYSGAPEHQDEDTVREFSLYEVEPSGRRVPVFERRHTASESASATQLEAIVGHVASYCREQGIERLPSICLAPLTEHVTYPADARADEQGLPLGIYDDPSSQYQGEARFDVTNTNVFVVGSSQSGKTNVLQAIVRGIAQSWSPAQASIYVLDFGSMILRNLEALAHVGGVVVATEEERVRNLFKLLDDELAARRARLLEAGVSSHAAYLEAGHTDLPHIYLIIDNFAVFKELYAERHEGDLLGLCRDGLTYGISVVVAASGTSGFGYRYMSSFSTYLALQCNDTTEYATVFGRCRMEPKAVAGRALCSFDKTIYEMQTYLAFEGEREIDRVRAMRAFAASMNARHAGAGHARPIPCVPDDLSLAYIRDTYRVGADELAFALDYATVEPVRVPLGRQFSLAVVGKEPRARTRVVHTLLAELRSQALVRPVEVTIVDGMDRELASWEACPIVSAYHADYTQAEVVLEDVADRLEERLDAVAEDGPAALAHEPYLVVVMHAPEAAAHISETKKLVQRYETLAKRCAGMRVLFVWSGVPDASTGFSSPALLKTIKEERRGIVTSPIGEQKFYDVQPALARALKGRLEEGQAFWVSGQDVAKVRLAADGTEGK